MMVYVWRFNGEERKYLHGRWYYPGELVENDNSVMNTWFDYVESTEKKEAIVMDRIMELRNQLILLKMAELRKIGNKYKVYDTKKSELISEIIAEKQKRGEI